jgi:dienelactone hydrolase
LYQFQTVTQPSLNKNLRQVFEIDMHPLRLLSAEPEIPGGSKIRRLTFSSNDGEEVRAFYLPAPGVTLGPAIVYIHAHGDRYDIGADELMDGRPALNDPLGPVLAEMGFAVLCIDLPGFGDRAQASESALAKKALWFGGSLAGQMTGELHSAFQWLSKQDGVDPARVGLFGISMGATLAYWLAAAEPRVAALAHLSCFANFDGLIETGAHDLHGISLTIPGLLNIASNGEIAATISPRPQFVGIGDQDPLTPPHATDPALAELRIGYRDAMQNLQIFRGQKTGHTETPDMRRAVVEFFKSAL